MLLSTTQFSRRTQPPNRNPNTLTRRRLTAIAAAVTMLIAPTIAHAYQPSIDETPSVDFILELTPGEDVNTHVELLLSDLGVAADQRNCPEAGEYDPQPRCIYVYGVAINGAFLRLTPEEVTMAQEAAPRPGELNAYVANRISVDPTFQPTEMEGTYADGPQAPSTGYLRIGAQGGYNNVDVAVLDTGVDAFNDDLNVVGGFNCTFDNRGPEGWGVDDYGHATFVASQIAGIDNDRGGLGVAPGARVWSFPVLSGGSGSDASVLCGVDQVALRAGTPDAIEVANFSLGGPSLPSACGSWDPMHNGFCNAILLGTTFVVSAGNDGIDAINMSPANYPEAVTVSALTDFDGKPGGLAATPAGIPGEYHDDELALFSDYGSVVDFIAPGVDIYGSMPLNTVGHASGTSMAAPLVSGVMAEWDARCGDTAHVVAAVMAWSSLPSWRMNSGWDTDSDVGPDHEPLVRANAPCWPDLVEHGIVEDDS